MRRCLEHAKIFGTCLTLNFVGKSTFQEFVFMKSFDVSSFFCSDFLRFLTLGFAFRLRPTKIFGTRLTFNFVDKSTLQERVFMKCLDVFRFSVPISCGS